MWTIRTMEYNEALKKKENLHLQQHGEAHPSGMSQSQKGKYYMILYEVSKIVKFIDSKSGMMVARSWGVGEMERY